VDNLIENELPTWEDEAAAVEPAPEAVPVQGGGGSGSGFAASVPPSMPDAMTLKVAYESAQQYTSLLNMLLGVIGKAIGGGHEARYIFDENQSNQFAKSLGEMMHYNQWARMNPNIMFLMTTAILVFPKAQNMYTDRKALKEAEAAKEAAKAAAARAAANASANASANAGTPKAKTTTPVEQPATAKSDTNASDEMSAGAVADLERLVATYELPESAAVALTIPEIGLSRPNFKLADKSITPNPMRVYYAYDVQNARIKKLKHEAAVNGNPSPYFETFILACEKLGLGEKGQEIACKALKQRIAKHYNITAEQVNAQRAKLLK